MDKTAFEEIERDIYLLKSALAMERSMSAFEANETIIFANDGELQQLVRGVREQAEKKAKSSTFCFHPGCTAKRVVGSHTIQKSTSLKKVAENGHLMSPTGKTVSGTWLGKVGYRQASVFPGFCETHENIFHEFEAPGDFQDESQICLQFYRTICREICVNTAIAFELANMIREYVKFRNRKLDESLFAERAKLGLDQKKMGVKKTTYKFNNNIVRYLKEYLQHTRAYLRTLKKMEAAAYYDIVAGEDLRFYYYGTMVDWEIPVCLAGRGGIRFKKGSVIRTIDLILNVLPYEGKTYILAGSFRKHKNKIESYLKPYLGSPFNLIKLVETWMLYGSDHWFLRPSVWNELEHPIQQAIYEEIYNSDKNILATPRLMIFRQTRLDLIEMYRNLGPDFAEISSQLEASMTEEGQPTYLN